MEEKKQKEEKIKRDRMEEEMREEQRIKMEIERENEIAQQEKIKGQSKNNHYQASEAASSFSKRQQPTQMNQVRNSPERNHSKADFQNNPSLQQPQSSHQMSIRAQQQSDFQLGGLKFDTQGMDYLGGGYANSGPSYGIINNNNTGIYQKMESNFNLELQKLKSEMRNQQQDFETQLYQLRDEAQKNIDFRVKAEQELQRVKMNSQMDSHRPQIVSSQSNNVRRSMAGIGNYEKMFFGGASSQINATPISSIMPGLNYGNSAQYPGVYQPELIGQTSQGLGGKFEGSVSLHAESTFVPLIQSKPSVEIPKMQAQEQFIAPPIGGLPTNKKNPVASFTKPTYDKYDGDVSLNNLENAIDEIVEMNMADNYKTTFNQLDEARQFEERPKSKHGSSNPNLAYNLQVIPEYKGIQQEPDTFLTNFSQANNIGNSKEYLSDETKLEFLQRNIPPMESIMESSNEQTFPSNQYDQKIHQQYTANNYK